MIRTAWVLLPLLVLGCTREPVVHAEERPDKPLEAAIPVVGYAVLDYAMNGREPRRIGNRSLWYAPQGCYKCSGEDNWLVITIRTDDEWQRLANAVGHPEWATDPRFADVLSRHDRHDEIDEMITGWTSTQDHNEAMNTLQPAGVIAAAVLNPKEVLFDPHLKDRGFFDYVDTENVGVRPAPHQLGAKFSAFKMASNRRAPRLGEHNREILEGLLALTPDEVTNLHEKGVIGDMPVSAVPLAVMRMVVQFPLTSYQNMGALGAIEADHREQLGIQPQPE